MTTTNEPTTAAAENPLDTIFNYLGIHTVEEAIARPELLLELPDEALESYSIMAAVRWSGAPSPVAGRTWEDFSEVYTMLLMQAFGVVDGIGPVLDDDGRECCEWGGRGGEKVPLTKTSLQHWQFLNALLNNEETARAWLAVVPAYARKAGDDLAAKVVSDSFATMVEEVQA
jgi:hypothetical protein